jgi:hypothetical protein
MIKETLDIEDFCLIINANDEAKDDSWKVYLSLDYGHDLNLSELEKFTNRLLTN